MKRVSRGGFTGYIRMWHFKDRYFNLRQNYSYKFQQPQKNHFSVDRLFSIHVTLNTRSKALKSGLLDLLIKTSCVYRCVLDYRVTNQIYLGIQAAPISANQSASLGTA